MAQGTYTEVTTQSWLSRMKNSLFGALIGILIFLTSFFVLWFNEGRFIKTAAALREVQQTVAILPNPVVSPQNEGKLIFVNGKAQTTEILSDEATGVSAKAIKLLREVEMYQWVESSKSKSKEKVGGSKETITTYTYTTKWSNTPQNSTEFKKTDGHINPEMVYTNATIAAENVSLGSFLLSPRLIDKIDTTKYLPLRDTDLDKMLASIRSKAKLSSDYLYIGDRGVPKPAQPKVGDYRIRYRIAPAETSISIISKQMANTFEPYRTKNGRLMELLENGTAGADAMVEHAQNDNQLLTWLLRLLGFILMFVGLALCLQPLSAIGAIIPILGRIAGAGTGIIAFLLSLALSLITIAIAWLFYRPVLAGILFLVAIVAVSLIIWKNRLNQI